MSDSSLFPVFLENFTLRSKQWAIHTKNLFDFEKLQLQDLQSLDPNGADPYNKPLACWLLIGLRQRNQTHERSISASSVSSRFKHVDWQKMTYLPVN